MPEVRLVTQPDSVCPPGPGDERRIKATEAESTPSRRSRIPARYTFENEGVAAHSNSEVRRSRRRWRLGSARLGRRLNHR